MNVLVTGAAGWLGRHLCPMLKAHGYEPVGLDLADGPHVDVRGSVCDRSLIRDLFARHAFDAVIHAGALHKPDIARFPARTFVDVNITGTLNLLEEAAAIPGCRLIFTSTTSLMISHAIREEQSDQAVWLDESAGPLEPRNIYGVTKLAAEGLCRRHHLEFGLKAIVLRTSRFFPEEDDTLKELSGENLKVLEYLYRRASVADMARAHILAMERAHEVGFGLYIVSAPTPFTPADLSALKQDAAGVIRRLYPKVDARFATRNWKLPRSIGRVYDGSRISRDLGFEYQTSFARLLDALPELDPKAIGHDPGFKSPSACWTGWEA